MTRILTRPVEPVFLKAAAVVALEHLVEGHDVARGGGRGPPRRGGVAGVKGRPGYGGHLVEQVQGVAGGVADVAGVELPKRRGPQRPEELLGVRLSRVDDVVRDVGELGCGVKRTS